MLRDIYYANSTEKQFFTAGIEAGTDLFRDEFVRESDGTTNRLLSAD